MLQCVAQKVSYYSAWHRRFNVTGRGTEGLITIVLKRVKLSGLGCATRYVNVVSVAVIIIADMKLRVLFEVG